MTCNECDFKSLQLYEEILSVQLAYGKWILTPPPETQVSPAAIKFRFGLLERVFFACDLVVSAAAIDGNGHRQARTRFQASTPRTLLKLNSCRGRAATSLVVSWLHIAKTQKLPRPGGNPFSSFRGAHC